MLDKLRLVYKWWRLKWIIFGVCLPAIYYVLVIHFEHITLDRQPGQAMILYTRRKIKKKKWKEKNWHADYKLIKINLDWRNGQFYLFHCSFRTFFFLLYHYCFVFTFIAFRCAVLHFFMCFDLIEANLSKHEICVYVCCMEGISVGVWCWFSLIFQFHLSARNQTETPIKWRFRERKLSVSPYSVLCAGG